MAEFTYQGFEIQINGVPTEPAGPDDYQGPYTEGEWVRIEAAVPVSWKGVSGCGSSDKFTTSLKAAMTAWYEGKIRENTRPFVLIPITAGYRDGRGSAEHKIDPITSKSKCKGSTELRVFLSFWQRGRPIIFDIFYVATRPTRWTSNPVESNPTYGPIGQGEFVFLSEEPGNQPYVRAIIGNNNQYHWVEMKDFRRVPDLSGL